MQISEKLIEASTKSFKMTWRRRLPMREVDTRLPNIDLGHATLRERVARNRNVIPVPHAIAVSFDFPPHHWTRENVPRFG